MFKVHFSCNRLCKIVPLLKLPTASEYIHYTDILIQVLIKAPACTCDRDVHTGTLHCLYEYLHMKRYPCAFLAWN